MNNPFSIIPNDRSSGILLKTSVASMLFIVLALVFAAGCNTNNSADKTTREAKADSVARSSNEDQGEHSEGMGDDNQGTAGGGSMMGNKTGNPATTLRAWTRQVCPEITGA